MEMIDSLVDLGRLIRKTRKAAGLRQSDAAMLLGVSVPFMNAVERGKPTAQFDKVLQVCRGLGIRVGALSDGQDMPASIEDGS